MGKNKPRNQITTAVSPLQGNYSPSSALQNAPGTVTPDKKRNLSNFIAPVQLLRIKYDVRLWRAAIYEMEQAYYPQRVKVQQMYRDTIINGHVKACVQKRERLTTLREFTLEVGDTEDKDLTAAFRRTWFNNFVKYCLDATYYGYSLISLGDIVNNAVKNVKLIQRWNVSPDRFNVTSYIYAQTGAKFLEEPYADWHVYVDTPSEDGQSPCGYGLFYNIGIYEILLRNNLGHNADFTERFSMPYVHGKTTKSDETERGEFENAIANMGSAGYAITDPMDEINFLEAALAGTGWNGYDNLEQRLEKKISKLILGHSDALDSTPGKLGGGQNGEESPTAKALSEVQSEDGRKIELIINGELIPKLRNIGINLPEGLVFRYKNDDEKEEQRQRQDNSNKITAEVAKTLKEAGFKVDAKYITERTGIPVEEAEVPEPLVTGDNPLNEKALPTGKNPPIPKKIQNKLKEIYR